MTPVLNDPRPRPVAETSPRATPGRCAVFLTHSSFSSPFRVGSHQLLKVLDGSGWRTLHVPTPVTPAHVPLGLFQPAYRARVGRAGRFHPLFAASCEYVPFAWLPWQLARLAGDAAAGVYARSQWRAAQRIAAAGFARPDLLFVDEPRLIAMARWFQPRCRLYRATDLYHEMMADRTVLAAERRALAETDGFIATSQPVFDHLRALAPHRPGLLVENGVDLAHFAWPQPAPGEYRALPGPRVVYVGAMDNRFDLPAVAALAAARPGVSFVLIGPAGPAATGLPANLHRLGPRPYEAVPAYLQHADAALLPLTAHPANRGRSPMKIYEYGAAGLPVIAARTDELARRQLPFVSLYDAPGEMPALLDRAIGRRAALAPLAREAAAPMSWEGRLREILRFASALHAARAASS